MTRTATRVAAAVGATVVMMGLATPAVGCLKNQPSAALAVAVSDPAKSSDPAKNDPGRAFHKSDHWKSLTLADLQAKLDAKIADGLSWLDAIEAKVNASDRLSDEQKSAVLARLQVKEDALTQLRSDVAAATTTDEVKAALKSAGFGLFGRCGWHHHNGRFGDRMDNGRFGDRNDNGRFGDRQRKAGFGGDRNQRHGDSGYRGGFNRRSGNDNRGGNFHH